MSPATILKNVMRLHTDTVSGAEKLASTAGGFLGILLITVVTYQLIGADAAVIIVPSMGASAVLLFAVPHGKLSQPWALFGGHLISAMIGVACYQLIPQPALAAALAVGLAIGAMHITHCMHPPGGATALAAVIGGPAIHQLGYHYVLSPILINSLIIFAVAIAFNAFFPWRRYPASLMRFIHAPPQAAAPVLSEANLDYALQEMDLLVDVTHADLQRLYQLATEHAQDQHGSGDKLKLGHYYTNGHHNGAWSVRQIVDESRSSEPLNDKVIYRVVEGRGLHRTNSCLRSEFAQWAAHEVSPASLQKAADAS